MGKTCKDCKLEKDFSCFQIKTRTATGIQYRGSCKPCQKLNAAKSVAKLLTENKPRKCTECKEVLPLTNFHVTNTGNFIFPNVYLV